MLFKTVVKYNTGGKGKTQQNKTKKITNSHYRRYILPSVL